MKTLTFSCIPLVLSRLTMSPLLVWTTCKSENFPYRSTWVLTICFVLTHTFIKTIPKGTSLKIRLLWAKHNFGVHLIDIDDNYLFLLVFINHTCISLLFLSFRVYGLGSFLVPFWSSSPSRWWHFSWEGDIEEWKSRDRKKCERKRE